MTTAQNSQFIVEQLLRVTAKEARYLERRRIDFDP